MMNPERARLLRDQERGLEHGLQMDILRSAEHRRMGPA